MTFRQALQKHLDAIRDRDLPALADTVAPERLVLVMADGRLARTTREFLDTHRGWFAASGWTLGTQEIEIIEGSDLALAVLRLDYREPPDVRSESYLTLVFQRREGRWLMILDQNTPIKK
jgi:ketosteroid isomerase-like protein